MYSSFVRDENHSTNYTDLQLSELKSQDQLENGF